LSLPDSYTTLDQYDPRGETQLRFCYKHGHSVSVRWLMCALLSVSSWQVAVALETEQIELGRNVVLEIVHLPGGRCTIGSPATERGRGPDEEQHEVDIAEFNIGRYPVTRGQFSHFIQDSGYRTEAEKGSSGGFGYDGNKLTQRKEFNWRNPGFEQTDDHPAVLVTYDDAQAFVRWFSQKTGRACSLPTENQWEYACRAGTTSRFYGGDDDGAADRISWYKGNSGNGTRPIGQKEANAFGLFDMCGNVYEWCRDEYKAYTPGGGVQGPMDKLRRVIRGGSWIKDLNHIRSAARARNAPGSRNADNGFRIVVAALENAAVLPSTELPLEAEHSNQEMRVVPPASPMGNTRPSTVPASNSLFRGLLFVALLGLIALIIAWVIYAILKRSNSARPRSLNNIRPRIVDDGFWFDSTEYRSGDVVTYVYESPDGPVTGEFVVEPSPRGQFIYTGARPQDILLGSLIEAEAVRHAENSRPAASRQRTTRNDDTFSGYPSAY
jgi:formylglycine-generating enzyme